MTEVATKVEVPERALCLNCNYPLRGLPEHRCPECGQTFDPADPWTMNLGSPMQKWARWWLKPTRLWVDVWALLGGAMFLLWRIAGGRFRDSLSIGSGSGYVDLRLPAFLGIYYQNIPIYNLMVLTWVGLLLTWTAIVLGRRWAVRTYHQPRDFLLRDLGRRRFAAWVFLCGTFVIGWYSKDCFHADHYHWYSLVTIDRGHFHSNNCPQMVHSVHLLGNWYLHLGQ